jgi:hypothetical protein
MDSSSLPNHDGLSVPTRPQLRGEQLAWLMNSTPFWFALFMLDSKATALETLDKLFEPSGDGVQHFIPQVMLARFRDDTNRLWAYDTVRGGRQAGTATVAHAGDEFYDFLLHHGQPVSLEKVWTLTEGPLGRVLPRLDDGAEPSLEEAGFLMAVVAQQIVRVPAWADGLARRAKQEGYEKAQWEEGELETVLILAAENYRRMFVTDCELVLMRPEPGVGRGFILSDRPVELTLGWGGEPVPDGLAPDFSTALSPELDLIAQLPLSARLMVRVQRSSSTDSGHYGKTWEIGAEEIEQHNRRAVARARRAVFGRRPDVEVAVSSQ